jgi:hypothetical protein
MNLFFSFFTHQKKKKDKDAIVDYHLHVPFSDYSSHVFHEYHHPYQETTVSSVPHVFSDHPFLSDCDPYE